MRICLIRVELFAWGKYGGFGRTARMLGRELVKQGVEVFAVVPRRSGQGPEETLDGMTVWSFAPHDLSGAKALLRKCNADVYHSQEASLSTYLAMIAAADKKHVVTFRDHKLFRDWLIELRYPSRNLLRTLLAAVYERNFLVARAIRRADALFCAAEQQIDRVSRIYGLDPKPEFLPSPIEIPDRGMKKSEQPTVLSVGRLDKRKRPWLFFDLVKEYPAVRFVAAGESQNKEWDSQLRQRYGKLPNLEIAGFINQFESDRLANYMEKSWVLANTAAREGLPTSFLEGLAYECAVLSHVNPDRVASRFGYHVEEQDFAHGLDRLLENGTWRAKGKEGRFYVKQHYDRDQVIARHINLYSNLIGA